MKTTTGEYVKFAVDVAVNRLNPVTDAVIVDVTVGDALLRGVPVITARPGGAVDTVLRVNPGGRFDPLNVIALEYAVNGNCVA